MSKIRYIDENYVRNFLEDKSYQVERELGKGEYGIVYTIKDDKDVKYAAKIMTYKKKKNKAAREEIEKEVFLLEYLTKEKLCNIIPCIRQHFTENYNGRIYIFIITDYIDGITLREFYDCADTETLIKVMYLCVLSLRMIHSYNIIHLDIHDENILITKDMRIYFIDFGLACYKNPCWVSDNIESLQFAPPEHKKIFSEQSDVYQLGMAFTRLIMGNYAHPERCFRRKRHIGIEKEILNSKKEFYPWNMIVPQMINCNYMHRPRLTIIICEYNSKKIFPNAKLEVLNSDILTYKSMKGKDHFRTSSSFVPKIV